MNQSDPASGLTTEHLKSHLQKYRMNYERSRREFQELCDREVKRDHKRRRRQEERRSNVENTSSENITEECHMHPFVYSRALAASSADSQYPDQFIPVQSVSTGVPELTDAQWRSFSTLMSTPEPLSIQVQQAGVAQAQEELQQMHQAMQAQMNFHRQMLTRKVELSNALWPNQSLENWNLPEFQENVPVPELSAVHQAWTSTQQIHQRQMATHRLQQSLNEIEPVQYRPDAPIDSLPTLVSRDPVESTSEAVGEDLNRWDPFNVGLGDDELFDFLKS
ncbi:hypothetical protein DVH05_003462 [Phytophthora capsici]|nr:hypothetical protein DVH05_003462 [Phytophthora capsici]